MHGITELLRKAADADPSKYQKKSFVPLAGGDPAAAGGGAMPPMDPAMMGGAMPPMDPAMMGGAMPPMDPAAMGGAMPPMDPSMMGGAMPSMDPAAALAPESAPTSDTSEGASKASKKDQPVLDALNRIESLLTNVLGALAKGQPVPDLTGEEQPTEPPVAAPAPAPSPEKMAQANYVKKSREASRSVNISRLVDTLRKRG